MRSSSYCVWVAHKPMVETEDKDVRTGPCGRGDAGGKHGSSGSPEKGCVILLPAVALGGSARSHWVVKDG